MRVEVAKLDKEAAEHKKQALILEGEGEAKKKELIIKADGALKEKLAAYVEVNDKWARAYATRKVPAAVFSGDGSGSSDTDASTSAFARMMQLQMMQQRAASLCLWATGYCSTV